MKKFIKSISITLLATLLFAVPTFAAKPIDLYIDDWKVPTESVPQEYFGGENHYYMDTLPQTKNGRTYVPISTITKFLGAEILWQNPHINIKYKDIKLDLTVGKAQAIKNGNPVTLDAPPYIYKNRTMVPLRFISEQLGLGASYKNQSVYITTPKLTINGADVVAVQCGVWMTMGGILSENTSNISITRIYSLLNNPANKKITYLYDFSRITGGEVPIRYAGLTEYTFLDDASNILAQYRLHGYLVTEGFANDPEMDFMIQDIKNDEWYQITEEQRSQIIDLDDLGGWKVIEYAVP